MSFNIGLSGLNAAQNLLSVSGNNIANANTTGFKETRAEFGDVYSTSVAGVSKTNPGAGAKVANDAQQFTQGNLQFTENSLDMAVSGDGFFVLGESVADPSSLSYSRDGSFHLDANGYVVNNNGNALMVYQANDPADVNAGFSTGIRAPVQINTSQSNPKATSAIDIGLNLNSTATVPAPASGVFSTTDPTSYNYTTSVNVFDSLGVSHTVSTYYVKTNNPPGSVNGGAVWDMYVDVDNSGATTGANLSGPTEMEFDTSGNLVGPEDLTAVPPVNVGSLTTGTTAAGLTVPGTTINFTPTTGAAPMTFSIDMSGSTQYNSPSSVNTLTKDGYAAGNLESLATDTNGVLYARYSNGSSVVLGEVALAKFQNPQGMSKLGDTRWAESTSSGTPLYGQAGVGSFGRLQSGALEGSNVDMASELVKLITAQQAYQANAQTIQTENTVITSLLNIR